MKRVSRFRFSRLVSIGLLWLWAGGASARAQQVYSHGDPSAPEQLVLQLINRARANPAAEGRRLGQGDFGGYPARPPLAFNAALQKAAEGHNADMASHGFFSHSGSDGSSPGDRATAAGYASSAVGENIAGGYRSAASAEDALMIDAGESDLGHRKNLLEYDASSGFYREVGVAYDAGSALFTQDFGAHGAAFVTGAAFRDADGDDFYSEGEGVEGVTVSSPQSSYVAVTSVSGGYALPMDKVGSLADGVTVTFRNASGATYSRSLALASTGGDGAPDNVECNVRVGVDLADTSSSAATVSLKVNQSTAVAATGQQAVVVFSRAGSDLSSAVTVNYKVKGAAVSGVDYKALSGALTLPAGQATAKLKIKPKNHAGFPAQSSLKVVLKAGSGYSVGNPAKAKVVLVSGE